VSLCAGLSGRRLEQKLATMEDEKKTPSERQRFTGDGPHMGITGLLTFRGGGTLGLGVPLGATASFALPS